MTASPVDTPLVSVGIPTYNRLPMLRRAIDSVLQEDYPNLELIISDNASTDGTDAYCQEIARNDPRVRFLRHPTNRGAHENFMTALRLARGDYFMWLGDDDWIDPGYLQTCANLLNTNQRVALVSGKARYYQGESLVSEETGIALPQQSPLDRLLAYFRQVSRNGEYYGLMRREMLLRAPYPTTVGGDWALIAGMACQGEFVSLPSICVNRALGGATLSAASVVRSSSSASILGRSVWLFWLAVAFYTAREILLNADGYAPLTTFQRGIATLLVFWATLQRYVRPEVGASLRRTRLGPAISLLRKYRH